MVSFVSLSVTGHARDWIRADGYFHLAALIGVMEFSHWKAMGTAGPTFTGKDIAGALVAVLGRRDSPVAVLATAPVKRAKACMKVALRLCLGLCEHFWVAIGLSAFVSCTIGVESGTSLWLLVRHVMGS